MIKLPIKVHGILLAVYFCLGVPLSYYAISGTARSTAWLYAMNVIFAVTADVLFFRKLFYLMRRHKVVSKVSRALKKALGKLAGKIGAAADRIFGGIRSRGKSFIGGKRERRFIFTDGDGTVKHRRRKMPRLPKNATEREKKRYAYVAYVFKKDKDIPSHLTPNEVGARLDPTGGDRGVFDDYNGARYAE